MTEGLSAFAACKGLQASVDGLVLGEGGAMGAGFPTVPTFMRADPRVAPLVAEELCTLAKGFPTLGALKGFHPRVNLLVLSEVFLAAEDFRTDLTLVALLPSPWMRSLPWLPTREAPALTSALLLSGVNALVAG